MIRRIQARVEARRRGDGDSGRLGADDRHRRLPERRRPRSTSCSAPPTAGCTSSAASHSGRAGEQRLGVTPFGPSPAGEGPRCALAASQRALQAIDRRPASDRPRAAPPGTATPDRPAARARRAARSGSRRRSRPGRSPAASASISPRVSSIRWRIRGMQVGVVEEHGAEAAQLGRSLPAHDLVVVELGQLVAEAGHLGVLVDLGLPAVGDRRGRARRRRSAGRSRAARGPAPWPGSRSGRPGPTSRPAARRARRPRRSRRAAARRRRTARPPRAPRRASTPPRRGAGSRPGSGITGTPSARAASASLPPVVADDPPGAERAGGLVDRQRLLGVARVARAQHRRVGRRPRAAARSRGRARSAGRRGRPAPRGPARRRSPNRPSRPRPGRRGRRGARGWPTPPATAHRAADRACRGCRRAAAPSRPTRSLPGQIDRGAQNLIAPSGSSTPGKIRAPAASVFPDPILTPSPRTTPPSMWQLLADASRRGR